MNAPARSVHDFTLADRFAIEDGPVFLNGIQALVRILLDQKRADRRRGLNTGGFVCGYPGSPVGGVDAELERNRAILDAHDIVHRHGLNEELAATAVFGTQTLHAAPGARYDGVFGMWFGKAPGVDRAIDAFRHANFRGVGRNGGVLAVAGDDPHARSTIFPSDSNGVFSSLYMPTLAPGNIQDVLDYGLHGYALSRAAGLLVGFKLVTDVADSAAIAFVSPERVSPILPEVLFDGKPLAPTLRVNEAGAALIEAERRIVYGQHEIARQYARLNSLNRIALDAPNARIGILTAGKTYFDLRQALRDLGFDDAALQRAGVRILKMGMIYPVEPRIVADFAQGLEEIIVVEDKRPLLEAALKEILYDHPARPRIVGKSDESGAPLLPAYGELSADIIARALYKRLSRLAPTEMMEARIDQLDRVRNMPAVQGATRTPYFCSGCPHNRSLRVPEGSVVGAGIGCHIMALWMGPLTGDVVGFTQMGGEGAQWVGLSPFTDTKHFFQNLGDGTFAHSGSLAIRFAISAGINVTYKILYNSTVAMTGGQDVAGGMTVPDMVKMLQAEGARRIVVIADDPDRYAGVDVHGVEVRHRDRLIEAETELAATPGVTVLINDQQCAAEKRRKRKRGKLDYKRQTVVINERVCEGCGDCGVKSNCLSVQPVETEFGRKTRIHQSSCNQDFSCLLGDCPSFMTVESREATLPRRAARPFPADVALAQPVPITDREVFNAGLVGIGGTGVVTVNQILGVAAYMAGLHTQTYDHTGSSQKAGPVISHLKISRAPLDGAPTISNGSADLYLVFDPLGAVSPANLAMASAERTVAIASTTKTPTGEMVADRAKTYPSLALLKGRLDGVTREADNIYLDAQGFAEALLGDHMASNLFLVGVAYQKGALPIPDDMIEKAVRLNGVAVETNIAAFRWGRLCVADSMRFQAEAEACDARSSSPAAPPALAPVAHALVDRVGGEGETRRLLAVRAPDLIAYQNEGYARAYAAFMSHTVAVERRVGGGRTALSEAVARNLYKLMAYKDEYEVARLMILDGAARDPVARFGNGARVSWNLHPTFLRVLGIQKKVRFGPWFRHVLRLLAAARKLRGTPFDPFGYGRVRRVERALIAEYRETLEKIFAQLEPKTYDLAVKIASAPDAIRGYEDIKLANVRTYREEMEKMLARFYEAERTDDDVAPAA